MRGKCWKAGRARAVSSFWLLTSVGLEPLQHSSSASALRIQLLNMRRIHLFFTLNRAENGAVQKRRTAPFSLPYNPSASSGTNATKPA